MIDHSEAYDKAVVSDSRRQFVRVVFDLYDPDMIITNITTNDESDISLTDQVTNRVYDVNRRKTGLIPVVVLDGSGQAMIPFAQRSSRSIGELIPVLCRLSGDLSLCPINEHG